MQVSNKDKIFVEEESEDSMMTEAVTVRTLKRFVSELYTATRYGLNWKIRSSRSNIECF